MAFTSVGDPAGRLGRSVDVAVVVLVEDGERGVKIPAVRGSDARSVARMVETTFGSAHGLSSGWRSVAPKIWPRTAGRTLAKTFFDVSWSSVMTLPRPPWQTFSALCRRRSCASCR